MTKNRDYSASDRYWQNWDKGDAAKMIDSYWLESEAEWRHMVVEEIAIRFGKSVPVFDVGCGSGLIYQEMIRHGVTSSRAYIGGDASKSMLAIARQRFPEAKFCDLDIFHLQYPDCSQPNVICIHVLQHLPEYGEAMRELIRITARKLHVVTWFTAGTEDELVFSEPSPKWDGQAFQNNRYSLPNFLSFIFQNSSREIEGLHVHHLGGPNYSVTITFVRESFDTTSHRRAKDIINRMKSVLKSFLVRQRLP